MAVGAMFSVQLGSALSLPLIAEVGAAGTAWLRLTAGALIFIAIARPPLRQVAGRDIPALLALGVTTGLMTIMFLAAINRIPLGTSVAIEFLGPLTVAAARSHTRRALLWPSIALVGVLLLTQPWQGNMNLAGIGFAASRGEAKRLVAGGGARLDGESVSDESHMIAGDGPEIRISAGKKKHGVLQRN